MTGARMRFLRAQFWSIDVIFSIVIFAIAMTVLAATWYSVNNQLSLSSGSGSVLAQLQEQSLAQSLFSTGSPTNWPALVDTSNSLTWGNVSIGLASAPLSSNFSYSKLSAFAAMAQSNYQATKQLLGVGFDYEVQIVGKSINMTIGSNPLAGSAKSIYVEKKGAFIGGFPVTVKIMLWTNSTLATV